MPFRARPMLATLVPSPFHNPGWVYGEKYDGRRLLAYKGNNYFDKSDIANTLTDGRDRPVYAAAVTLRMLPQLEHLPSRTCEKLGGDRGAVACCAWEVLQLQCGGSGRVSG